MPWQFAAHRLAYRVFLGEKTKNNEKEIGTDISHNLHVCG